MSLLKAELTRVNRRSQQTVGRVPSRRLSRQEYEHTLDDLLGIGAGLAKHLPPENKSGAFDVIAANQELSSVHVRSLLMAADLALDEAIQRGRKPPMARREIDYLHSPYIQMWVDRPVRRGGGTVFKTDHDVVTFRGENYVFRSDVSGFRPPVAGQYRITVKAAAHQPRSSITVSLKRQNDGQGESELFAAWDLAGSDYREAETITYLRPDDYIYVRAWQTDAAFSTPSPSRPQLSIDEQVRAIVDSWTSISIPSARRKPSYWRSMHGSIGRNLMSKKSHHSISRMRRT